MKILKIVVKTSSILKQTGLMCWKNLYEKALYYKKLCCHWQVNAGHSTYCKLTMELLSLGVFCHVIGQLIV